jgi:hypothetical protein
MTESETQLGPRPPKGVYRAGTPQLGGWDAPAIAPSIQEQFRSRQVWSAIFPTTSASHTDCVYLERRLIRCTVPGLTANRSAILRTPGHPGVARACLMRGIGGQPSLFPSRLGRAGPVIPFPTPRPPRAPPQPGRVRYMSFTPTDAKSPSSRRLTAQTCEQRPNAPQQIASLFDHLVGARD